MLDMLLNVSILDLTGSAGIGLLGFISVIIVNLIRKRFAYDIVDRAFELALYVVGEVWQTFVQEAKANAKDGKLTPEQAKEAKSTALKKLKCYLGPKGLGLLVWLFGYSNADLDAYLEGMIEAAIDIRKTGVKIIEE